MSLTITYLDLLPKELLALCIPFDISTDKPYDVISKYGNPVELFEIWFNNNYPDYFKILKFDQKLGCKYLINKLFKWFKYRINYIIQNNICNNQESSSILLHDRYFNILYPIIYEINYPKVYKNIIKYYEKNGIINNIEILLTSLSMLIPLQCGYTDTIIKFNVESELKILIIKSSEINIEKYIHLSTDDLEYAENDEFIKYLVKGGANVE